MFTEASSWRTAFYHPVTSGQAAGVLEKYTEVTQGKCDLLQ